MLGMLINSASMFVSKVFFFQPDENCLHIVRDFFLVCTCNLTSVIPCIFKGVACWQLCCFHNKLIQINHTVCLLGFQNTRSSHQRNSHLTRIIIMYLNNPISSMLQSKGWLGLDTSGSSWCPMSRFHPGSQGPSCYNVQMRGPPPPSRRWQTKGMWC